MHHMIRRVHTGLKESCLSTSTSYMDMRTHNDVFYLKGTKIVLYVPYQKLAVPISIYIYHTYNDKNRTRKKKQNAE